MPPQATVFLVDDDPAVRDALGLSLRTAGLKVETYPSAASFLEHYASGTPGCLVLDVRMPDMSGLELQQLLAAKRLALPIIFITGHGDIPMSVQAIKAGAIDFLEKPFAREDLLDRVAEAIAEDARRRGEKMAVDEVTACIARLTPREREVMALVVAGKSNKVIGRDLDLSYRTVEVHRSRVMEKMRADSLPELVAKAVSAGILSPRP